MVGLGDFLASLKIKMRLIISMALVIAAVAMLASLQRSPSFSSEAKVLVEPIPLGSGPTFRARPAPNMSTEEELIQSARVVRLVIRRLDTSATEEQLERELRVDVAEPPEARILVLTYTHSDPVVAQERVQAFADAYIESRRAAALAELARQEPDVGAVVQDASAPLAAPVLNLAVIGGIGFLMGLAGGIAVAAIGASIDERPRSSAKLESSSGVPVLAAIPRGRVPRNEQRGRLICLASPRSAAAETYRVLGTLVEALSRDGKILLVTSAEPGEGKSTISANLAVALAETGHDVALVDCNPRGPSIHTLFQTADGPGLVHVLAGTAQLGAALNPSGTEGLEILTAGRRSSRSAEVLASPRLRQVIEQLASTVDFVILDGPSLRVGSDALAVALISDAALLVADALVGDVDSVSEACQQLQGVGVRLAGAVLNNSREGAAIMRASQTSSTRPWAMASGWS